jgi:hypothetical protein
MQQEHNMKISQLEIKLKKRKHRYSADKITKYTETNEGRNKHHPEGAVDRMK